jgi:hypothetical protein
MPYEILDDILLPQQFFPPVDGLRRISGISALLYAILEDAVACLQKKRLSTNYRARRVAVEAEEWLFTDDYHWPFSFLNICAVLGLDPAYLRLGLQRWRRQQRTCPQKNHRRTQVLHTPKLVV